MGWFRVWGVWGGSRIGLGRGMPRLRGREMVLLAALAVTVSATVRGRVADVVRARFRASWG